MSNNLSISTVVSPDILKTISSSVAIKTFGDQLVNKAKDKVISVVEGKVGELKKLIEETVKQSVQAGIDHNTELKRLEIIFKNKQITEEQYNAAVAKENEAYKAKIDSLEAQKINTRPVPRRLTHVVAPSPVRRTDASARSRWKRSRSVRVARGRSGPRPPAAPAGPRQTHSSHAVAGGGGGEVHPPAATPGP